MAADFGFVPETSGEHYFISYNTEDAPRVGPIAAALHSSGLPLWYDYGLEYGEEWERQIAANIRSCKAVIMFVTRGIFRKQRTYVRKEYEIAIIRKKHIIPVFLDDIDSEKILDEHLGWWVDICSLHGIKATGCGTDSAVRMIRHALGPGGRASAPASRADGIAAEDNDESIRVSVMMRDDERPVDSYKSAAAPKPVQRQASPKPAPAKPVQCQTVSKPVTKPADKPVQPVGQKSVDRKPIYIAIAAALVAAIVCGAIFLPKTGSGTDANTQQTNNTATTTTAPSADGLVVETNTLKSLDELDSVSVGDHFTFGSYPQSTTASEPIEWRVLDVENGKVLAVSEYLLDARCFDEGTNIWNVSGVKAWLNVSFVDKAFSSSELNKLVDIDDNEKVTLLTQTQAKEYFSDKADRIAKPTHYAIENGANVMNDTDSGIWWLKPVDPYGYIWTPYVDCYGNILARDMACDNNTICVRPVITISQ